MDLCYRTRSRLKDSLSLSLSLAHGSEKKPKNVRTCVHTNTGGAISGLVFKFIYQNDESDFVGGKRACEMIDLESGEEVVPLKEES